MSKKAVGNAESVQLAGEFNDWRPDENPMKKLADGSFSLVMELETGREYQYRYLIDHEKWENDWEADKYIPSGTHGVDNSVVVL